MKKWLITLLCGLSLTACQLPQSAEDKLAQLESAKERYASLYVYLKELKASLKYAEFWITVHRLEGTDSDGQAHVLFDAPEGKAINLISHDGLDELLTLAKLPVGDYQSLTLTVGRNVHIVTPDQKEIDTHFPTEDSTYRLTLSGLLSVSVDQIAHFIVNIDPDQFIVDAQNALAPYQDEIKAAIEEIKDSELYQQITTELEGTVVEIKGSTVWIQTDHGVRVKVVIPGFASIYNEHRSETGLNLTALQNGQLVRIFGKLVRNGDEIILEALTLALELNEDDQPSNTSTTAEVKGEVVSVDLNNGTLVLDVKKASFVPGSDHISVIDLNNALFVRGTIDMLAADVEVRISGHWDGSQLDANVIKIDAAADSHKLEEEGHRESLNTLAAVVTLVNLQQGTIEITTPGSSVPMEIAIDLDDTWFQNGDSDCLQPGASIQLYGTPSAHAGSIDASSIVFDEQTCSTEDSADQADADHDEENSAPATEPPAQLPPAAA
ncbi:MAG: DUF4382 domain-containing protein [Gammaproteobacteria bacterium]|nr:DUF4382 domain-containing protein [Gammaproteobacteria bacterium]